MKIEICKSYGVLGYEKVPFYSLNPASDIYDRITVNVPDDLYAGENAYGDPLVTLSGMTYKLDEVLRNRADNPMLAWHDGDKVKYRMLSAVSELSSDDIARKIDELRRTYGDVSLNGVTYIPTDSSYCAGNNVYMACIRQGDAVDNDGYVNLYEVAWDMIPESERTPKAAPCDWEHPVSARQISKYNLATGLCELEETMLSIEQFVFELHEEKR